MIKFPFDEAVKTITIQLILCGVYGTPHHFSNQVFFFKSNANFVESQLFARDMDEPTTTIIAVHNRRGFPAGNGSGFARFEFIDRMHSGVPPNTK